MEVKNKTREIMVKKINRSFIVRSRYTKILLEIKKQDLRSLRR